MSEEVEERDRPTADEIVAAWRFGWLASGAGTEASLRAAGYNTTMGYAFPDPDDPSVSREIDVTRYQQLYRRRYRPICGRSSHR